MPDLYDIITSVAYGHAYQKHEVRGQEFTSPDGLHGPSLDVRSRNDLASLMRELLDDENTKAFYDVDKGEMTIVNTDPKYNIVIELNNSVRDGDAGSIFRPENPSHVSSVPQQKYDNKLSAAKDAGLDRARGGTGQGVVLEAGSPAEVRAMMERFATENADNFNRRPGRDTPASDNNPQKRSTAQRMRENSDIADELRRTDSKRLAAADIQAAQDGLQAREGPQAQRIQDRLAIEEQQRLAQVQADQAAQARNTQAADVYTDLKSTIADGGQMEIGTDNKVMVTSADGSQMFEIEMAADGQSARITHLSEAGEVVVDLDSTSKLNHLKSQVTQMEMDRLVSEAGLAGDGQRLSKKQVAGLVEQSDLLSDTAWANKAGGANNIVGWLNKALKNGLVVPALAAVMTFGTPDAANAQVLDEINRPMVEIAASETGLIDNVPRANLTPAGLSSDIRAAITQGMQDGLVINADDAGRMSIVPETPGASRYDIKISDDGLRADVLITAADGRRQSMVLDQEGMGVLNDMLKSEEFARAGIVPLEDIVPTRVYTPEGQPITLGEDFGRANGSPPNPETPRVPGAVSNGAQVLDEAGDLAGAMRTTNAATDAMRLGKAGGRAAKLSWVGGVALTGGVAALIHYAHSSQRDLAGELHDAGRLSDEAYEEYLELNREIEIEMQTENAAGQGWFFLVTTPAVEARARSKFEEFSQKHNLPEDVHQALGMSLFDGQSLRGQFAEDAMAAIPDDMSDMPAQLHGLWRAKQELDDAQGAYDSAHRGGRIRGEAAIARRDARRADSSENLNEAQAAYQREFAAAFSDPDTADFLLQRMPQDTLLEMVEATAQYNAEGQDPLIQRMADLQAQLDHEDTGFWDRRRINGEIDDIKDELAQNPEIVHGYIADVFGERVEPQPEQTPAQDAGPQEGPLEAPGASFSERFSEMPVYMQNRLIESVATSLESTDGAHPYLKDLSELYAVRNGGGLRGGASRRNSANASIDHIEEEIRAHPEIMAEYAQDHPDVQAFLDQYDTNRTAIDAYASIPEDELRAGVARIESLTAGGADVSGEHPLVQKLAALQERRENIRNGRAAKFTRANIDAEIRQIKDELMENPDVVSNALERMTGDGLVDIGEQGTPDTLDLATPAEEGYGLTDPTQEAEFIEVAMAIERLRSGEPLEAIEQQRVLEILNDPSTDPQVLAALENQYGQEMDQFTDTIDLADNSGMSGPGVERTMTAGMPMRM